MNTAARRSLTKQAAAALVAALLTATLAACAGRHTADKAGRDAPPLDRTASSRLQWTGIAVTPDGRIFVNYPRWSSPYRFAVGELHKDGSVTPYPNEAINTWNQGDDPAAHFICVQSVHAAHGRLWVLDPAAPRLAGTVEGGPKLVEIDPATNRTVRTIAFAPEIAPTNSYLNDIRFTPDGSTAFITDSGLGAIIVLDVASGAARRLLADHPSTKAQDITLTIGGEPFTAPDGSTPRIHSDGLAVSPDGQWLYYQALTSRTLYRAPVAALSDTTLPARDLAAKVENLGTTVVTDGMDMDRRGNLYFSALEKDAVIVRTPDGALHTLVTDPAIRWPDSFALGPDDALYFTTAQIHLTPPFAEAMPETAYLIFRTRQHR